MHHALSTACRTHHHLEFQGFVGSLDDDEGRTGRSHWGTMTRLCRNDLKLEFEFMIIDYPSSIGIIIFTRFYYISGDLLKKKWT